MEKSVRRPAVQALGLSLEFYREAIPGYMQRLEGQFQRFLAEINPHADIRGQKLCCCQQEVEAAVRQAAENNSDALLLVPLSYTASLTALGPIVRSSLPVIIWNTQEARAITERYNFDDLLMNHVTQGTQDITNVLVRSGKPFGMESGHYSDQAALTGLADWLNAAKAIQFAKRMRVGRLGNPFQDMGDFGVDETAMIYRWGPSVVRLSVPRLVQLIKEVDEDGLKEMRAEDCDRFDVAPEVSEEIHYRSLRLEVALRKMIAEERLDAFTMNFRDLIVDGRIDTLPFLGLNKMLGEGLGYAGEGNDTIAALMAQLRQLCGVSNFTEIYTVDYEQNLMVMTHMQECNPALARKDRKVRLIKKDFWAPGIKPYVGMHFSLEPGPVTLCNLTTDRHGDFYYIVMEAEIVDRPPFEDFDIPHWVVRLDEPVGDFLTRYSLAGGTHHLSAVPGRRASRIQKLAALQEWKCLSLSS